MPTATAADDSMLLQGVSTHGPMLRVKLLCRLLWALMLQLKHVPPPSCKSPAFIQPHPPARHGQGLMRSLQKQPAQARKER